MEPGNPKHAGVLAILAGLLTPSWWVLPQVLAGLGLLGAFSASCLFWLEKLQPVFFILAIGSLAYQIAIYVRRPKFLRTAGIKAILFASVIVNVGVIASWIALWYRYRWWAPLWPGLKESEMRLGNFRIFPVLLLALLAGFAAESANAQVERVLADAQGITWPSCAAVMEIALKRLEGVDKVAISIERQQFEVYYKSNASFQPDLLREAVAQSSVSVVKFRVQVRGKVEKLVSGRVLTAVKDKYAITADSKEVPLGTELVITGDITNDRKQPYQLKIIDFKPSGGAAAAKPAAGQPAKK